MREIQQSPLGKCHSDICCRQDPLIDDKISGAKFEKKQDIWAASKYLPQIFLTYRGKNYNFITEKCSRCHVNQAIKVCISDNIYRPYDEMHWEGHSITSLVFWPKIHNVNHEKTSDTNWAVAYWITEQQSTKPSRRWKTGKTEGLSQRRGD